MIRASLTPEALAEKLSPPRALERVAGALYAPPLSGGSTAWAAWLPTPFEEALDALIERARRDGATTLAAGGPPGNYLATGVDEGDRELCEALESKGFVVKSRHLDLDVATRGQSVDARVTRSHDAAVIDLVARSFSTSWSMEAARALPRGGLFIARGDGGFDGFACHSGNAAWASSFGPIGVTPHARGAGLGRALASTVLADLAARGFDAARVPWVDGETARFYESFCEVLSRAWRAEYRLRLSAR